jgi:hypothetical protein
VRRFKEPKVILDFRMNSLVTVEPQGQGLWSIRSRYDDNLFSAEIVLDVKLPALDIRRADLEIKRDVLGLTPDLSAAAEKLVGVRVGQGMTKIVRGVVCGPKGSDRVAELVLEAMEMLINALTAPELRKAALAGGTELRDAHDGPRVYLNDVVISESAALAMAANPRLKDSCIAFRL